MERTKSNSKTIQALETKLRAYSELYNRLALAQNAGYSYDGDRNLYQALGYKTDLTFTDYYSQYKRQDIARAVIDRPVQVTWRGKLKIVEAEDDRETKSEIEKSKIKDSEISQIMPFIKMH
jgi:hypothetical protein